MASSVSFPARGSVRPAGAATASPLASASTLATTAARAVDAREATSPLASLALGAAARVVRLDLDDEHRDWLAAVGIGIGERVVVLRRAVFGGPLHVRTSSGGEFALNRALARQIVIRLDDEESAA